MADVDFDGLNFKEFIYVLEDVTKGKCPVVYYCLGHKSMRDGLTPLKNDDDYRRFLDAAHEEEKEEKGVDSESFDEDKDSVMSDALSVDHEPDEEVIPLTKSDDPFLNYISVVLRDDFVDEDDDSDNGTKEAPIYPFHDSTQKWDTMQPILGPSTKAKKKKGKHVPDVEDESEFEIEDMAEVEDEYESESESEIEELAEDVDEPDQGQEQVHESVIEHELEQIVVEPVIEDVEEPAAQLVVEVEQRAQPLKRKRKYSERITEVALRRVVITKDGCGLSVNKPVTLE
ncbi:unnamed protein product [Lactuca saligna]|uniref:Uncharacterized protein n=1 Tax=Lactuca saligna TaxID=75948 RepID=A0AA35YPD8_LACSI|nr:unnamed protein product [Lactuca saligna]